MYRIKQNLNHFEAANNHYKSIVEYKNGGIEENEWDSVSIPDQPLFLPTDLESDMETDITDDDQSQDFKKFRKFPKNFIHIQYSSRISIYTRISI